MTLLACGINHKTAPIALREQLALHHDNIGETLQGLLDQRAANEAMILSTCNRTEIYSKTDDPHTLIAWLSERFPAARAQLAASLYTHQGVAAVEHAMRVGCGLDSMVLGEPQILGQMKEAVGLAKQAGGLKRHLSLLFQRVFSVTKQVRTDTGIGTNPLSVAAVAVDLVRHVFANISKSTALLIGAGETIELMGLYLQKIGVRRIIVVNRTYEKANVLAKRLQGHPILFTELPTYLKEADIIVSATASQVPILGKGALETAIKARRHRPMFLIDLAVPRDIEPEVSDLEDAYLYNIDDLRTIATQNLASRADAALQAEEIIRLQAEHFMRELQALDAVSTIRALRTKAERLQQAEIDKALQSLQQGQPPEQVLEQLASTLTNKLLHTPTVRARQAGFDGQNELLAVIHDLFGLD